MTGRGHRGLRVASMQRKEQGWLQISTEGSAPSTRPGRPATSQVNNPTQQFRAGAAELGAHSGAWLLTAVGLSSKTVAKGSDAPIGPSDGEPGKRSNGATP
jgi:hypothetical protein